MVKNTIMLSIHNKEKNLEELSRSLGIKPNELKPFVDELVNQKKLAVKDGKYELVKQ